MNSSTKPSSTFWGLLRRRECLLPTFRGWLVLLLVSTLFAVGVIRRAQPFLALNSPLPGGVLVVEGWVPDYALEAAAAEFRKNSYAKLYVTGVPLEQGARLAEYQNHAQLGAALLLRLGLSQDAVQAVPAPAVGQDRTYASAVALKNWLRQHGTSLDRCNVISLGPHARRTRLLFKKALGAGVKVGITSVEDRDYDPRRWWKSSQGVRLVVGEMIAYGYAKVLFRPANQE